jgi:nifR3 family TIM-barrel protein
MKIGSVHLQNNVIMAPLAGVTNLPFRLLAKSAGCGLVCSEMISANGLVHGSLKTLQMLTSQSEEKPLSVQIFGTDPRIMAEAAQIVEASGADMLDINFGCAVRKVVKTGAGVALMRRPESVEALLCAVRRAVTIPLTIKIRSGWSADGRQAVHIAKIAAGCGVDAVTVHPRTATQGFGGTARWPVIAEVKSAVDVPVIGNGDIRTPLDAVEMMRLTRCDGVMIGRAAINNPLVFSGIRARLSGIAEPAVERSQVFSLMKRYVNSSVRFLGEERACRLMRSRLGWFVKGLPNNSRFRESIKHLSSRSEALEAISRFAEHVGGIEPEY